MRKTEVIERKENLLRLIDDYKRILTMESFKDFMNSLVTMHDNAMKKAKSPKASSEAKLAALAQADVLGKLYRYPFKFIEEEAMQRIGIEKLRESL